MATATAAGWQTRDRRSATLAGQIYTAHRGRLLAIASRNSACAEDAEEALQDSFILFIDHFEPDSETPPLAWLTLTLKRRCWALYRLQRRGWEQSSGRDVDRCCGEEVPGGCGADQLELAEEVVETRNRLGELKRDERRALSLLAVGYSYREIGELTGWTYTKVNRCLAEGRAALRELKASDCATANLPDV